MSFQITTLQVNPNSNRIALANDIKKACCHGIWLDLESESQILILICCLKATHPAGVILWKKTDPSSPSSSGAMRSSARGRRDFMPASLFHAGVPSGLSLQKFVHAVTAAVGSCEQLSCSVWKTVISWSHPPTMAFIPLLPWRSLSLEQRGCASFPCQMNEWTFKSLWAI